MWLSRPSYSFKEGSEPRHIWESSKVRIYLETEIFWGEVLERLYLHKACSDLDMVNM
jgi:hypothetical protein